MNKKYMDFVPARKTAANVKPKAKPVAKSVTPKKSTVKSEIQAIKAQKVGMKATAGLKPVTKKTVSGTFNPPKAQFINKDKVVKRPLSKNVYQKKVATPKEEPKGPVRIIEKPEKQPKVNLIVTIILTIILGAAAGTVAFLLLPK